MKFWCSLADFVYKFFFFIFLSLEGKNMIKSEDAISTKAPRPVFSHALELLDISNENEKYFLKRNEK